MLIEHQDDPQVSQQTEDEMGILSIPLMDLVWLMLRLLGILGAIKLSYLFAAWVSQ